MGHAEIRVVKYHVGMPPLAPPTGISGLVYGLLSDPGETPLARTLLGTVLGYMRLDRKMSRAQIEKDVGYVLDGLEGFVGASREEVMAEVRKRLGSLDEAGAEGDQGDDKPASS